MRPKLHNTAGDGRWISGLCRSAALLQFHKDGENYAALSEDRCIEYRLLRIVNEDRTNGAGRQWWNVVVRNTATQAEACDESRTRLSDAKFCARWMEHDRIMSGRADAR